MKYHLALVALALAALALAACGDSTGPKSLAIPFAFVDPVGDTIPFAGSADILPALDARGVSGVVTADSLILTIEFTTPISAEGSGRENALVARIEIDSDADASTGIPALTEPFPNTAGIGVDDYIFVPDAGGYGVEAGPLVGGQPRSFPATYGANSITMRLPLSAIGVTGGRFRFIAIVGTLDRPTDLLPNSGAYELTVPGAR